MNLDNNSFKNINDNILEWFQQNNSLWSWRPHGESYQVFLGVWLENQGILEAENLNQFITTYNTPEKLVKVKSSNKMAMLIHQRNRGFELADVGRYLIKNMNNITRDFRNHMDDIFFLNDWIASEIDVYGFEVQNLVVSPSIIRIITRLSGFNLYPDQNNYFSSINTNKNAPILNTALESIARQLCATIVPQCLICPLLNYCHFVNRQQ
jgi:adenine-specific DNA glycosylase